MGVQRGESRDRIVENRCRFALSHFFRGRFCTILLGSFAVDYSSIRLLSFQLCYGSFGLSTCLYVSFREKLGHPRKKRNHRIIVVNDFIGGSVVLNWVINMFFFLTSPDHLELLFFTFMKLLLGEKKNR